MSCPYKMNEKELLFEILRVLKNQESNRKNLIKEWFPIVIKATIPLSTAAFTSIVANKFIEFDFDYEFKSIYVVKETDSGIVSIIPRINNVCYPFGYYILDSTKFYEFTASLGAGNSGYFANFITDLVIPIDFPITIDAKWKLELLGINTHTSDIVVNIFFNGYKLHKKETTKDLIGL